MNDSTPTQPDHDHNHDPANASPEDMMAALFANMVIQQTNMAMMLLGKVAHPETGKIVRDIEAAKMFIDQLEMLEVKTQNNLSKPEKDLLKQALGALHLEFVNAVDPGDGTATTETSAQNEAPPQRIVTPAAGSTPAPEPAPATAKPAEDDSRKRFSKKY